MEYNYFHCYIYNGRIDTSPMIKTQEIILINLKKIAIVYSHILMVMLGEEVVGVGWCEIGIQVGYRGIEELCGGYPLGSYVIFLTYFLKFLSYWKGEGSRYTIFVHHKPSLHESIYKIVIKEHRKQNIFFFCFLHEATLSVYSDTGNIFSLLLKKTIIVFRTNFRTSIFCFQK